MEVLAGIGVAAAIGLAVVLLNVLERYSVKRYRVRFMTKAAFGVMTLAVLFYAFGIELWREAAAQQGDPLNGILLMALAGVSLLGQLTWNIYRTNLLLGTTGTLVQTAVLGSLAAVGIFFFLLYAFAKILLLTEARPVYQINR